MPLDDRRSAMPFIAGDIFEFDGTAVWEAFEAAAADLRRMAEQGHRLLVYGTAITYGKRKGECGMLMVFHEEVTAELR